MKEEGKEHLLPAFPRFLALVSLPCYYCNRMRFASWRRSSWRQERLELAMSRRQARVGMRPDSDMHTDLEDGGGEEEDEDGRCIDRNCCRGTATWPTFLTLRAAGRLGDVGAGDWVFATTDLP